MGTRELGWVPKQANSERALKRRWKERPPSGVPSSPLQVEQISVYLRSIRQHGEVELHPRAPGRPMWTSKAESIRRCMTGSSIRPHRAETLRMEIVVS